MWRDMELTSQCHLRRRRVREHTTISEHTTIRRSIQQGASLRNVPISASSFCSDEAAAAPAAAAAAAPAASPAAAARVPTHSTQHTVSGKKCKQEAYAKAKALLHQRQLTRYAC